jgi:hypothetical protein
MVIGFVDVDGLIIKEAIIELLLYFLHIVIFVSLFVLRGSDIREIKIFIFVVWMHSGLLLFIWLFLNIIICDILNILD